MTTTGSQPRRHDCGVSGAGLPAPWPFELLSSDTGAQRTSANGGALRSVDSWGGQVRRGKGLSADSTPLSGCSIGKEDPLGPGAGARGLVRGRFRDPSPSQDPVSDAGDQCRASNLSCPIRVGIYRGNGIFDPSLFWPSPSFILSPSQKPETTQTESIKNHRHHDRRQVSSQP